VMLLIEGHSNGFVLLFDLDGTLLPIDPEFFFEEFPDAAASYFCSVVDITEVEFKRAMFEATFDMVENEDPEMTNIEVFGRSFASKTNMKWEESWAVFDEFYRKEFPKLKRVVPETDIARRVVSDCVSQGWDIVLATNPVFPEIAIRERMSWCHVEDFNWQFITTMENMHYCKPNVKYYYEIIWRLDLAPEKCVMIGNDVQEDMIASVTGMKTVLVEDYCIDRSDNDPQNDPQEDITIDERGMLVDVPEITGRILSGISKDTARRG